VLRSLPGKARSRFSSGRFLRVEDGAAVFAVPDRHMLTRCEESRADAESALAAAFGRPVPLRLVEDPGGPSQSDDDPVTEHQPPDDCDDTSLREEFDDFEDAGAPVTSAEQRLLEAFPGAEEVRP
jgi:hypothetical protein